MDSEKNLHQRNAKVQAGSSNFITNCITRERNKQFWLTHVNRFINALMLPNLYPRDSSLLNFDKTTAQEWKKSNSGRRASLKH